MAIALFGVFFLFLLFGLPIAFSIMLGAFFGVIQSQALPLMLVPQRMLIASDNFSMLAIPLFILAGDLMNTGGITHRMVTFAYTIVGHIRGGLGITSITASMIFAGISGSAVADTAAVGALLIPSMVEKKYKPGFAATLQAAGGTLGPIIPPSILMVLYGSITNVSIGGLFLALLIAFLMLLGMVVEVLAIATIFGPLLSILGAQYGFDPIHFGLIILVIIQIGGITPPVGIVLQITCGIAKIGFGPTIKYLVWYILAMFFVIFLVILFPGLATYLPHTLLG